MRFTTKYVAEKDDSVILLISAIVITLLLFIIDQGWFNFSWMTEVGHWIVFIMYSVFIFIGEFFVSNIILKNYHSLRSTIFSIATGSGLGIVFVLKVILNNW